MGLRKKIKNMLSGISMIQLFPERTALENINPAYSSEHSPDVQDAMALREDWVQTGKDIYSAIKQTERQYTK